jgi:hypothetical protein
MSGFATGIDDTARPPFVHPVARLKMNYGFPLRGARQHLFCQKILQSNLVQHRISQKPLELVVLALELSQSPGLGYRKAAILGLPAVDRRFRHSVPPSQICGLRALFRQDRRCQGERWRMPPMRSSSSCLLAPSELCIAAFGERVCRGQIRARAFQIGPVDPVGVGLSNIEHPDQRIGKAIV